MNYTTNYHLPQWVESDRILMEDFNEAMSGIDGGIAEAKTTAETAESKADTAQSAAEAAQNSAAALADAYTPSNKPYVVGSYSGSGVGKKEITLGFRPAAVLISGDSYTTDEADLVLYSAIVTADGPGLVVEITDTGFEVAVVGSYMPFLNRSGYSYRYIAFR